MSEAYLNANVNLTLTDFGLAMSNDPSFYVADRICPPIEVLDLEGDYFVNRNKHMRRVNTKRKPGTPAVRINNDVDKKQYKAYQHSAAEEINQERKIRAKVAGTDVEEEATNDVMETLLIDKEAEIAELVTDSSKYISVGHYTALSSSMSWSKSTATPFQNIATGRAAVIQGCGKPANILLIPYDVWLDFSNSDEYLARLASTGIKEPSVEAFRIMLGKEKMQFDDIIITPATYNTSEEKVGETADDAEFDFVWPRVVVIARVEADYTVTKRRSNTAFANFSPKGYMGLQISTRRDENTQVDLVEGDWWYGAEGINYKAAYLFGNA